MRNGYFNYEKLGEEFTSIDPDKAVIPVGEQCVDTTDSIGEYNKGADIFSTFRDFQVRVPKNTQ